MWEVVATNRDGRVRSKMVTNWKDGIRLAKRAMEMGWKVTILPVYVDFFVVTEQGELMPVVHRVKPQLAAQYAIRWAKKDRNQSGCIAWPHKMPLPSGWKVQPIEQETNDAIASVADKEKNVEDQGS